MNIITQESPTHEISNLQLIWKRKEWKMITVHAFIYFISLHRTKIIKHFHALWMLTRTRKKEMSTLQRDFSSNNSNTPMNRLFSHLNGRQTSRNENRRGKSGRAWLSLIRPCASRVVRCSGKASANGQGDLIRVDERNYNFHGRRFEFDERRIDRRHRSRRKLLESLFRPRG